MRSLEERVAHIEKLMNIEDPEVFKARIKKQNDQLKEQWESLGSPCGSFSQWLAHE